MKKYIMLIAFGFGLSFTHAQINDPQKLNEFDKLLSAQYKSNETGVTAIVTKRGEILYHKAFGMADLELKVPMKPENVFRIGSITKQITAVAILQLAEQGKLNLQDELTKFIPDYPVQGNRITIEHLLTHTSGIRNFSGMNNGDPQRGRRDLTPVEMIDYFKNEPLRFTAGTKWEYSNSGYFLLGYIIEKITNIPYGQYIEENIFKPAGMENTLYANDIQIVENRVNGYSIGDNGIENAAFISMTQPYAAGAVESTVEDLFKWQQALLSGKLLNKETIDKAWKRYKLSDGRLTNYGYGWRMGYIHDSPSLWHGGLIHGFLTMAMYLPQEDVFIAVFSNCDGNSPEDLIAQIAAIAIEKPYTYQRIPLENPTAYTGVYENENGQQRIISVANNQLFSQLGRGPKFQSMPYEKDKFYFDDNPFLTMHFKRNKNGTIESVISRNREGEVVWTKTNKPVPNENGIRVDEKVLSQYTGVYEITPEFKMDVIMDQGRLYLQATGQERLEMFAESDSKFFLKVNDAEIEFITGPAGDIIKAIINQGGRQTDAKKVK